MLRLILFPLRLVRAGIRLAGIKNSLMLLIGVGIGLLVAPTTGRELRSRLAAQLAARRTGRAGSLEPLGSGVTAAEPVGV